MPFCTHCGHAFTEGAKFCNACGRDLGPVATTTPKRPSRDDSVETSPQRGVGDIPNLIDLAGPGLFLPEIVGEASYQPALESIAGGKSEQGHEMEGEVSLIHDDKNPYDKQAIKVEIDGETVGYLSRNDARKYRKMLAKAGHRGLTATCKAMIVGGWDRGGKNVGNYGVRLDIEEID